LPRNAEKIYGVGSTFDEALNWLVGSGTLVPKRSLRVFNSGIGEKSIELVAVKRAPTLAKFKESVLALGLHDQVEEVPDRGRARILSVYIPAVGGYLLCAGTPKSYTVALSHACKSSSKDLRDVLGHLKELGFIPPRDAKGKPQGGMIELRKDYFKLDPIPAGDLQAERRKPADMAKAFIRTMYAWETGMNAWCRAGYPIELGHDLIPAIFEAFGIPKENKFDDSYTTPSEFDPKNEEIVKEKTPSKDEVELTTRAVGPVQISHKLVLRREDGVWRLSEVWRKDLFGTIQFL
jgi:hypothetical protein